MKICIDCRREMKCIKNGVFAHFGDGHVYSGDSYQCPKCLCRLLDCTTKPWHHPDIEGVKRENVVDMTGER